MDAKIFASSMLPGGLPGRNKYIPFHPITFKKFYLKKTITLKILHLIDSGGLYGAEIMLLTLAREQQRLGLQPVIGSIGTWADTDKALEKEAVDKGITVRKFRMRPGPNLSGLLQILRYCQTENFHLIHSHGYKGNILMGFVPPGKRLPLVATLHGWTSQTGFSRLRLYEWLDAISLRFLDAVVVVNRKMLQHPGFPRLAEEKVFVIDNGIPRKKENETVVDTDIVDFCRHGTVVGSIGRCSLEKGFDVLLRAFARLHKENMRPRLLLIGDGPQRKALESLAAALGVEKYVMFAGYRPGAEAYMNLMDLYVISSSTEGLPMTLLEAMRAKVPVVSTSVGGIPDVLEGGIEALLVSPDDVGQLAAAIVQALRRQAESTERAERAYRKFVSRYSSETMAAAYSSVYRQLLFGNRLRQ